MKRGYVPEHVVKHYRTARRFKKIKRGQVRAALREVTQLREGCAFFPCGSGPVGRAQEALEVIQRMISVKAWGR